MELRTDYTNTTASHAHNHPTNNSVDIRDRDFKAAKRWSDEMVFANRAYFLFEKQPGELAVQNAKENDSGIYRCRVDFKVAQTRNSKVNLTVIRKYIHLQLLIKTLSAGAPRSHSICVSERTIARAN